MVIVMFATLSVVCRRDRRETARDFEKDGSRSHPDRPQLSRVHRPRSPRARRTVDGRRPDDQHRAASPRSVQPPRGVQRQRRQRPGNGAPIARAEDRQRAVEAVLAGHGHRRSRLRQCHENRRVSVVGRHQPHVSYGPGAHTWIVAALRQVAPQIFGPAGKRHQPQRRFGHEKAVRTVVDPPSEGKRHGAEPTPP